MRAYRIILSFLIFILICQISASPVHAEVVPPNIAFVDPAQEITRYTEDISGPIPVDIVNTSAAEVTLQVYTVGIDILQPDASGDIKIAPGAVKTINFFLLNEKVSASAPRLYSGFLVFTTTQGDFIYKVINIDSRPKTVPPETATKDDIKLLAGEGDISINWTDLQDLKVHLPIINTGKNPSADLTAELQFMDLGNPVTIENVVLPASSLSELVFDLGEFHPQRKSYAGFLTIQDGQGLFLHNKVTLYFPSSGLVSPAGSELAFLGGEDPIAIKYYDLAAGSPFEIRLTNKGLEPVTVTTEDILVPGLVDQAGARMDPSLLEIVPANLIINPLEIGSLQVKLAAGTVTGTKRAAPREGDYTGYLVLRTDVDQALIVKTFTLKVAAIDPGLPTYVEQISLDIQVWWQHLSGIQARFGNAEWPILIVLLVLLLGLVLWLLSVIRVWWWNVRGRLGPVYVEEIKDKPGPTALLRETLSNCGLMPSTSTPSSSRGATNFETVLSESKIPEVKFIQAILNFFTAALRTKLGYEVTSTMTGEDAKPPVSISIQIEQTQNGQIKLIKTISGDTYDQVVKDAAFYIFHFLTSQKAALRHIPTWSRFPTPETYRLYKDAENADCDQALKLYEEAAKIAPFNALLRQGWGDAYEVKGEFLKALKVYLEAACVWPELYEFWYRIAAVLSFADRWFDDWTKLDDKETIVALLDKSFKQLKKKDKKAPSPDQLTIISAEGFIDLSISVWTYLESQFKFGKMTGNWIRALLDNLKSSLFQPADYRPHLPAYYWDLIPFLWSYGAQMNRAVTLGEYCSKLRAKDKEIQDSEVEVILRKYWNHSNTYYNAACFYAIKASQELKSKETAVQNVKTKKPDPKETAIQNAMTSLKKAIRDPRPGFDKEWVKADPDLQSLHEDLEFKALFDMPDEKEEKNKKEKEERSKYLALFMVLKGAKQQMELLKEWGRSSNLHITPEELLTGASHRVDVWKCFNDLAGKPSDATAQKKFWDIVMLYTDKIRPLPRIENYPPAPELTGEKLDECWKAIKEEIQPNPALWESRASDAKLFLEHAKTQKNDVWELWSKAEIRKWEYITERITDSFPNL